MTAAQEREARETRRAVASLVRRLQERDEAVKDGGDVPDWEPFAAEFIAALRGQGWRWLANLAPHRQQQQADTGRIDPDVKAAAYAKAAAHAEEMRERDRKRPVNTADTSYPSYPERTIS